MSSIDVTVPQEHLLCFLLSSTNLTVWWTGLRNGDSVLVSEILSKGFDAKLLLKDVPEDKPVTPNIEGIKGIMPQDF